MNLKIDQEAMMSLAEPDAKGIISVRASVKISDDGSLSVLAINGHSVLTQSKDADEQPSSYDINKGIMQ